MQKKVLLIFWSFIFYKNGNSNFSKKLSLQIKSTIKLIAKYNYAGKQTDEENIRVFIKDRNAIFYEMNSTNIIVHLVWDCRRNPEELEFGT
ncbi:MAG: type II toxin-antitoxin system RelE/ParE family toxin [Bacteroidia bacterium]